jgi:hypothetical protein
LPLSGSPEVWRPMDTLRLRNEFAAAQQQFSNVELRLNERSELFVKAALQTSAGGIYILSITFDGFPHQMPRVWVDTPSLLSTSLHRYRDGNICYLHPSMWNPGLHNLTFVIARASKWLNKYEVWKIKGTWPGAQLQH